jgi:hypothetical protein
LTTSSPEPCTTCGGAGGFVFVGDGDELDGDELDGDDDECDGDDAADGLLVSVLHAASVTVVAPASAIAAIDDRIVLVMSTPR